MTEYLVECEGNVREVYLVEAGSPEEAMGKWASGELVISEAYGVGDVSAKVDE